MLEFREVSYDYIEGNPYATIFTSKRTIMNDIMNAKKHFPNDVDIISQDEDTILAHVPKNSYASYNRFVMPKKREVKDKKPISEEQKKILVERMRLARASKNKN